MKHRGWIEFHTVRGSPGSTVTGGCIFDLWFAIPGLNPGTLAGAVGTRQMDALLGVVGMQKCRPICSFLSDDKQEIHG